MEVGDTDDQVCMMRGCTEVDLLPARCVACKRLFCSAHIGYAAHQCAKYERSDNVIPLCPLCNQPVAPRNGQSADAAVNEHIESGCRPASQAPGAHSQAYQTARDGRVVQRHNYCSHKGCSRNEIQLILCDRCGSSFCVDHRSPAAHNCIRASPPPQAQAGGVSPRIAQAPQVARTTPPMSPQPRPKRSTPSFKALKFQNGVDKPFKTGPNSGGEGHLVVGLFFPHDASINPCFFDVSPSMTVGRMIDVVARQVDLPNSNNAALPESERLHMFNLGRAMLLPSSLRVDEAAECEGGPPMLMITRGPKLPPGVEEEIASMRQQNGSVQLAQEGRQKKDCTCM